MSVSFNDIPSTIRVPLVYIEFDNSRAVSGTPAVMHKILVLGQKLAAGSAAAAVPVRITSADQAGSLFGRGSMLHEMFVALKAANRYTETWSIPLEDNVAGVAASGTIAFTGVASASGAVNLYVGGIKVVAGVASGDTATITAAALAAAINAKTDLPVTASAALGTVTLTARHKGEVGNGIDLRLNYYQGEVLPTGVAAVITAMASGATNPDLATALAAFGQEWWNSIVMPYTDGANLAKLKGELDLRWGPTKMMDGIAYAAFRGTHAATGTFGSGLNTQHLSVMGCGIAPTAPHVLASVYAAVAAASLSIDPARPLQTLPLPGVLAPALAARWTMEERNLLLFDGISTAMIGPDGTVMIERAITTYQVNAFGVSDPSYLDVNTPATLSYIRYATRARITQKFPRHKLADDGTRFSPGQAIVTPKTIKAELMALFRELELAGLVEDFSQYKADLIVERNANDRNRLDVLSSPNLINQFRVFAEQIQFIV
jgi:phage tail sheath gpL-like